MLANLECSVDTVVLFMWMTRMWFSEFIHRCHQHNVSDGANTMKRLAIHKLRDRYFTPIFYTTYNAQFAHDYRLLCFQMYFRTRTGTMEPTKSHKVALINHSAILHLSRSIGVNGHVRNRFCKNSKVQLRSYLLIVLFPAWVVSVAYPQDRPRTFCLKRPPLEHLPLL